MAQDTRGVISYFCGAVQSFTLRLPRWKISIVKSCGFDNATKQRLSH
jgi:hypothetical protein